MKIIMLTTIHCRKHSMGRNISLENIFVTCTTSPFDFLYIPIKLKVQIVTIVKHHSKKLINNFTSVCRVERKLEESFVLVEGSYWIENGIWKKKAQTGVEFGCNEKRTEINTEQQKLKVHFCNAK